jgi:cardiolipin synthase
MTLANWLTLSRIAAIPLLVTLLYIPGEVGAWSACVVFALAGFTDWLDGHVARTRNQGSDFGRMMDPIADKLLVASALLVMVATQKIAGWAVLAALVVLCREILVSGLREYLASLRVGLPVSRLAKWKTGLQMGCIGWLIVGDDGPAFLYPRLVGEIMLWAAAVMTLWTGWDYLRAGLGHARPMSPPTPASKAP